MGWLMVAIGVGLFGWLITVAGKKRDQARHEAFMQDVEIPMDDLMAVDKAFQVIETFMAGYQIKRQQGMERNDAMEAIKALYMRAKSDEALRSVLEPEGSHEG